MKNAASRAAHLPLGAHAPGTRSCSAPRTRPTRVTAGGTDRLSHERPRASTSSSRRRATPRADACDTAARARDCGFPLMLVPCPQPRAGRSAWQTASGFPKAARQPLPSPQSRGLSAAFRSNTLHPHGRRLLSAPPPGPAPVLTTLGHAVASICPLRTLAGRLVHGKHLMTPSCSPQPHLCFHPLRGTSGRQSPPASLDGTLSVFST